MGAKELEQLKHLSSKIQEVTSNVLILWIQHLGTQVPFSDKVAPDIDDFPYEPEFQCYVQVVKTTFVDDFK